MYARTVHSQCVQIQCPIYVLRLTTFLGEIGKTSQNKSIDLIINLAVQVHKIHFFEIPFYRFSYSLWKK